jgi:hypothetical protein
MSSASVSIATAAAAIALLVVLWTSDVYVFPKESRATSAGVKG